MFWEMFHCSLGANNFYLKCSLFAVVSWQVIKACHSKKLNWLVRKTQSVLGQEVGSKEVMVEKKMRRMASAILDDTSHSLCEELWQMGSPFSHILILPD